jgi:hypothetical protein
VADCEKANRTQRGLVKMSVSSWVYRLQMGFQTRFQLSGIEEDYQPIFLYPAEGKSVREY